MCISDTRETNLIHFFYIFNMVSRALGFLDFFRRLLPLQLLSPSSATIEIVVRVLLPIGDHTILIVSTKRSPLRKNRRHQSSHSLTWRLKLPLLMFRHHMWPLLFSSDHPGQHHLFIPFRDLAMLIRLELFGVLGYFISLFLHDIFCYHFQIWYLICHYVFDPSAFTNCVCTLLVWNDDLSQEKGVVLVV